jgi:ribosomal protein L37E
MKHPTTPCSSCPYRKDVKTHHWDRKEFEGVLQAETTEFGGIYACHKMKDIPNDQRGFCAGWLLDQKKRDLPSIRLRIALAQNPENTAALNAVHDGGHPLYTTVKQMCRANGVRKAPDNKEDQWNSKNLRSKFVVE